MTADANAAIALARMIRAVLAGYSPAVGGAVLAQLLAHWLADHPAIARDGILDLHVVSVRRMLEMIDRGEAANYITKEQP